MVFRDVLEPDEQERFECLHVLVEALAEDLDKRADGHEGVLLHASGLVVDRGLEHLQHRRHDRVRDLRGVLGLDLSQYALK